MRRSTWFVAGVLLVVTSILVLTVIIGGRAAGDGEVFGGSDAAATASIEDSGYEPWWEPIIAPAGEVESGLFALQAAIGGGVLGFVLGTLRERRRRSAAPHRAPKAATGTDGASGP